MNHRQIIIKLVLLRLSLAEGRAKSALPIGDDLKAIPSLSAGDDPNLRAPRTRVDTVNCN